MKSMPKDTFINLSISSKLDVLFDGITELYEVARETEVRTNRMERKFATVAAVFGIIGATTVAIVKWIIGK